MNNSRQRLAGLAALALAVGLSACGGGGGSAEVASPPPPSDTLTTNVLLTGHPQALDIYAPVGATRAIVFLHGATGSKERFALQLGINGNDGPPTASTVNWTWLRNNQVVAIFAQGQSIPAAPLATTWSNHVMTSGVDDVSFLQDLSTYVRGHYGLGKVYVMGHSNGAMMANRMWCESPTTFDGYIALSGPSSSYYLDPQGNTTCLPPVYKPYYGVIGSNDTVLRTTTWTSPTWTLDPAVGDPAFLNYTLVGEWAQFTDRARLACRFKTVLGTPNPTGINSWTACGGLLQVDEDMGEPHTLTMPDPQNNPSLLNRAIAFINQAP